MVRDERTCSTDTQAETGFGTTHGPNVTGGIGTFMNQYHFNHSSADISESDSQVTNSPVQWAL